MAINRDKVKSFFDKVSDVFGFIGRNLKWVLAVAVLVLFMCLVRSCNLNDEAKKEKQRLENNILALNDTLKNYKKNGVTYATMRALQLRIDELADSLKLERGKTPVTIINYVTSIDDTVYLASDVVHDTAYINGLLVDRGVVVSDRSDRFGKSTRHINVRTPYRVVEGNLLTVTDSTVVLLEQDIWLESALYKDRKGYTYIQLKTDYPSVLFNNGTGILVDNGKKYEYSARKSFGLGIGFQVGYGMCFPDGRLRMSPYVGIGLGLQWNPKFLQF